MLTFTRKTHLLADFSTLVCKLKWNFIHTFSSCKHKRDMLDKISNEPNKHVQPCSNFSVEFFVVQWQFQVHFES